MWAYQGDLPTRGQLADGACRIEIERLRRPIGKQEDKWRKVRERSGQGVTL